MEQSPSPGEAAGPTASPPRIDLAFSGGGVRAALFAVGVVLYLIDSDVRTGISSISSVSGGSMANAVLAGHDITKDDANTLKFVLQRFALQLAMRGSFFGAAYKRAAQVGVALTVLAAALCFTAVGNEILPRRNYAFQFTMFVLLLCGVAIYLLALRGRRQRAIYRRFLRKAMLLPTRRHNDVKPERSGTGRAIGHLRRAPHLRELPATTVTHIFCATDLTSGGPIFISRDWIYSPAYGYGTPANIALADAVYASAAFPLVFPPLQLKVDPTDWSGGELADRPPAIRLADGGICNNLGTDWQKAVNTARTHFDGWDTPTMQLPKPADTIIVVNASAPPRLVGVRGTGPVRRLRELHRMILVMFENTLRPRLERMGVEEDGRGEILVDIAETPLALAQRIVKQSTGDVRDRAGALVTQLNTRAPAYWAEYSRQTSQVRTTLDSVGVKQAAQLVRHGYLSAAVACHSYLASADLDSVPCDRRFVEFFGTEGARAIIAPPRPA